MANGKLGREVAGATPPICQLCLAFLGPGRGIFWLPQSSASEGPIESRTLPPDPPSQPHTPSHCGKYLLKFTGDWASCHHLGFLVYMDFCWTNKHVVISAPNETKAIHSEELLPSWQMFWPPCHAAGQAADPRGERLCHPFSSPIWPVTTQDHPRILIFVFPPLLLPP